MPLTSYEDYAPYLLEQREDALPERPVLWQRTSGRSGEYPFKLIPVTGRVYEEMGSAGLAMLLLSSHAFKGDVGLANDDRFLYGMAPRPYTSGTWAQRVSDFDLLQFLPDMEESERLSFEERIQKGFELALSQGMDLFYGLASVLVAVGERFSQRAHSTRIRPLLAHPRALLRLARGLIRSKLARRPMLPKDLWSLKGLACAGADATVYRERIREMWGRYPLQIYSTSESILVALQPWDAEAMTFVPHFNFLEFIPEEERLKEALQPTYQPRTLLLDQVRPGQRYELVVTNFLGGPFVRYRVGDVVEITSMGDEKRGIRIPQMFFHARVADLIDIAGFTRLTETAIGLALERAGISCGGWTAHQEAGEKPKLHVYMETRGNGHRSAEELACAIHQELKAVDRDYADVEEMLGLAPLHVSLSRSSKVVSGRMAWRWRSRISFVVGMRLAISVTPFLPG